jgi:hypothetical protein
VDGFFHGDNMALTVYQVSPIDTQVVSAIVLSGRASSSGSFTMDAFDRQLTQVGSVTVTRN